LNKENLLSILRRIDGRGYKAYKDLRGKYDFSKFLLFIDYVQGDPFASPSRCRVRVAQENAGFPRDLYASKSRRVATQDYIARQFAKALQAGVSGNRGTGKSGLITIDRCGQEVLERTAVVVCEHYVEARISVGLPARGRTVLGRQAAEMLTQELPEVVEKSLFYSSLNAGDLRRHVGTVEDQDYLRERLPEMGLVAFVGNGAVLPRKSGVSDLPLKGDQVVPFYSPPELEVEVELPNAGRIKGMGVSEGVTLIVGGGYHGKSTLLRALERGVYNHIPGDGREQVVTVPDAVKIRAEDGRRIEKVNISPFINNLPFGRDTEAFSSDEASGSTSQAANIIEALEMGTHLLLVDEDTSATNFMIRDMRMQHLVTKEKEPITPFIDRVQQLARLEVSTCIVIGGSGDYFDVADTVIMMDNYSPRLVTAAAKRISAEFQTSRKPEGGEDFNPPGKRCPDGAGLDPTRGRKVKIAARGLRVIAYGRQNIDLTSVEQLVDTSQTRAIGDLIHYIATRYINGSRPLAEAINLAMQDIEEKGLDIISPYYGQHPGDYAMPRPLEVAAAFNRLRSLRIASVR